MPLAGAGLIEYAGIEPSDALKRLNTPSEGLSEEEVLRRLKEQGYNVFAKKSELNIFSELLSHFKSPLIIILLFASGISAYLGEIMDAVIIGTLILVSVALDFFEEHNAGESVKKLISSVKATATVIRGSQKIEIKASDICTGDLIFLSSGNLVPADARIISARDFFVNQSALTGESFPCEKTEAKVPLQNTPLSELTNIIFAGTNVISGSATAVVVRTGGKTEFGGIASSLSRAPEKSEFELGITSFGYLVMRIMLFLVLFIFLFNSIVNNRVLESFMFAVAIAVGLTPELLPMIMSVTMARGSLNMAGKGVIVKKLASIPNFGSMDVLCTDKTGTITEDRIELVRYTDVSGRDSERVLQCAYLNSFHQTGIKNPLDEAVLNFRRTPIDSYRKVDEIPFDFFRKRMSIVVADRKWHLMITKGAPEEVFKCCTAYRCNSRLLPFNMKAHKNATEQYHDLSAQGYRVLAIATKRLSRKKKTYSREDESGLELQGFVAFFDPAKRGIRNVLPQLSEIGVEIKIITGDNELVTEKVCREIGLSVKGILLGEEIDALTDDALRERVERTTIFARFSPDEKNRVIHALKSNGHVVGYMGDGINDAPSLKASDVGISVNNAVDVAKEYADIVLTHKSLRVLNEGILEGRKAFGNTMKYIMIGLSSNFGNMFSAAGAILFLPFLPMLPVQILLNNFIYDFSQVTIPTDSVDYEWTKQPKRWNLRFIKRFMYVFGPISSMFDFLTFFLLFSVLRVSASAFQTGWFIESLATQTLVIHVIRTKKLPFIESTASKFLLISTALCVALGWIIPYTRLGAFFGFEPLPAGIVAMLAAIVVTYLVAIEITKRLFYRKNEF